VQRGIAKFFDNLVVDVKRLFRIVVEEMNQGLIVGSRLVVSLPSGNHRKEQQ
jgi:hypothetical protein